MSSSSEQVVSVTITPGPFEVTVGANCVLVTDTRGSREPWELEIEGAESLYLSTTMDGSAPGLVIDGSRIVKDTQVGPGGSTGGQWLFKVLRSDIMILKLTANDLDTSVWAVGLGETVTNSLNVK